MDHTQCGMDESFSDGEGDDDDLAEDGETSSEACGPSSSRNGAELPRGVAEALMNGALKLPFSDKFSLPSAVPCGGGCGEAYYCR